MQGIDRHAGSQCTVLQCLHHGLQPCRRPPRIRPCICGNNTACVSKHPQPALHAPASSVAPVSTCSFSRSCCRRWALLLPRRTCVAHCSSCAGSMGRQRSTASAPRRCTTQHSACSWALEPAMPPSSVSGRPSNTTRAATARADEQAHRCIPFDVFQQQSWCARTLVVSFHTNKHNLQHPSAHRTVLHRLAAWAAWDHG